MQHRYTLEEELELGRRIRQGDLLARNALVEANEQVVRANLKAYAGRGVDDVDLYQEGWIGLIRASEDYDPAFRVRFASHARHWVRELMRMAVSKQSHPLKVPLHTSKAYTKIKKFRAAFFNTHGFQPSDDEVAAGCKLKPSTIESVRCCEAVLNAASLSGEADPLDPWGDEDDDGEVALIRKVVVAVRKLPGPQREVLVRRFGLDQADSETLADVCRRMKCSKDALARLERAALDHLQGLLA